MAKAARTARRVAGRVGEGLARVPYTNLITFFRLGRVGRWDPNSAPGGTTQRNIGGDFDVTSALNPAFQVSGYTNIDDVLALFDAGEAPEPGSMLPMGTALVLGLLGRKRFR